MAEIVGLAASIVQIAGTGVKLSTALYNFGSSVSRAETDIADIADDVRLTANALDNVGKVFEQDDGNSVVSRKAVQDAQSLIKRCEAVFGEVQELVNKRRKTGKDGKKLSTLGKFSWPLKEQRVELLRRRLESLKNSLMLLLHVLQLANGQAKGEMEKSALDQERERIRELHQRQQDSLKALQALESKLNNISLSDEETLHGSTAPSRVPTVDLIFSSATTEASPPTNKVSERISDPKALSAMLTDDSETSDSDGTLTEDEGEHLTVEEITQCTKHVQKLLNRITVLQRSFETATAKPSSRYPKYRVHKLYRRFCRKFESEIVVSKNELTGSTATLPSNVSPSQVLKEGASESHGQERWSNAPHLIKQIAPLNVPHGGSGVSSVSQDQLSTGGIATRPLQTHKDDSHQGEPRRALNQQLGSNGRSETVVAKSDSRNDATSPSASPNVEDQVSTKMDIMEQMSQEPGPVHYTKTGRISKAKKGLKVHTCECGKSFTRAEHLRRHQKNHGSNQVQCDLCGKVFFRADLLQRHRERHKDGELSSRPSTAIPRDTADDSYRDAHESQLRPILPASGHCPASAGLPHLKTQGLPSLRTVLESSATSSVMDLPSPFLEPSARTPLSRSLGMDKLMIPSQGTSTSAVYSTLSPHLPKRPHQLDAETAVNRPSQVSETSRNAFPHTLLSPSYATSGHPPAQDMSPSYQSADQAIIPRHLSVSQIRTLSDHPGEGDAPTSLNSSVPSLHAQGERHLPNTQGAGASSAQEDHVPTKRNAAHISPRREGLSQSPETARGLFSPSLGSKNLPSRGFASHSISYPNEIKQHNLQTTQLAPSHSQSSLASREASPFRRGSPTRRTDTVVGWEYDRQGSSPDTEDRIAGYSSRHGQGTPRHDRASLSMGRSRTISRLSPQDGRAYARQNSLALQAARDRDEISGPEDEIVQSGSANASSPRSDGQISPQSSPYEFRSRKRNRTSGKEHAKAPQHDIWASQASKQSEESVRDSIPNAAGDNPFQNIQPQRTIESHGEAPEGRNITPRTWKCDYFNCTSTATFTRLADLQRHHRHVHGVGEPDFPCTVKGCTRVGEKGFARRDHLIEHLRNFHHLDIPKRKPAERSSYPLKLPNYNAISAKPERNDTSDTGQIHSDRTQVFSIGKDITADSSSRGMHSLRTDDCRRCKRLNVNCDRKLPACTECEKSNDASECATELVYPHVNRNDSSPKPYSSYSAARYTQSQVDAYYRQYNCYPPQPFEVIADNYYAQPAVASGPTNIRDPAYLDAAPCVSQDPALETTERERLQKQNGKKRVEEREDERRRKRDPRNRMHVYETRRNHRMLMEDETAEAETSNTQKAQRLGNNVAYADNTSQLASEDRRISKNLEHPEYQAGVTEELNRSQQTTPKVCSSPSEVLKPRGNEAALSSEDSARRQPKTNDSSALRGGLPPPKLLSSAGTPLTSATYIPDGESFGPGTGVPPLKIGDRDEEFTISARKRAKVSSVIEVEGKASRKRKMHEPNQVRQEDAGLNDTNTEIGRRKRSKDEDDELLGFDFNVEEMESVEQGRDAPDERQERDEGKDIVDLLLEQWTVPVY